MPTHRNAVPPDLLSAAEAALRNPDDETAHQAVEDRWRDVRAAKIDDEQATLDRHIDALVARAPRMTSEQSDRLRRLFAYGPPPTPG